MQRLTITSLTCPTEHFKLEKSITFQLFDYPLTEIAKNSGVSYSTLQTFWNKLERNKIVIKTRRIGKSDMYKLNTNNPAVKQLIKLDWNLIQGADEQFYETIKN